MAAPPAIDKGFGAPGARYQWLPGTERQKMRFWILVEQITLLQYGTFNEIGLDTSDLSKAEFDAIVFRDSDIAEPFRREAQLILRVATVSVEGRW